MTGSRDFKMLNLYAVDIPTLPVNFRFPHVWRSWWDAEPFSWDGEPQQNRLPSLWDTRYYGKRLLQQRRLPQQHYPQESNPWISNVSEHTSPHVATGRQTPSVNPGCQSGPSARNSTLVREDLPKNMWTRPPTTANFRPSF